MNFKKLTVSAAALLMAGSLLTACGNGIAKPAVSFNNGKTQIASHINTAPDTVRRAAALAALPDGVVPVTWEPSSEHLIIDSEEARTLYKRIKADNYPTVEELKSNPVTAQIDALSTYYKKIYGNTADINTPERKQLRKAIEKQFLSVGSARTESVDPETGRHKYVYDGDFAKEFKMELVLGLPASGKSTRVTDPDSEEMKAFILDCDVVKEMIPEFQESHGAAADAVHFESFNIMDSAMQQFLTGDMKGTNVIIPIVASDFDELMKNYIQPFEQAGYHVTAKFVECEENASVSRNIARELETGRIINSAVVLSFGEKPLQVYKQLAPMQNAFGETYGKTVLSSEVQKEVKPAA